MITWMSKLFRPPTRRQLLDRRHPHAQALADTAHERLERLFANAPEDSGPPPGVQIACAYHGRIVYAQAIGLADAAAGTPLTLDHAFTLASQSKPVAAIVAALLADRGVINLDEPVLGRVQAWRPTAEQLNGHDPHAATIRHILSHTSGWDVGTTPMHPCDSPDTAPTLAAILSGGGCHGWIPAVQFAPGTDRLYCGTGYVLLQLALEAATGKPYAELVNELLARPLGWQATRAGRPTDGSPVATGHAPFRDRPRVAPAFFPALAPSGMVGTAPDMARLFSLVAASAHGQATLMRRESALAMLAPAPPPGKPPVFGLGFALGQRDGLTTFQHAGWCPGFWGITEGLAELGVAVSVQCNMSEPAGRLVARRLSRTLLDRVRDLHGVAALADGSVSGDR